MKALDHLQKPTVPVSYLQLLLEIVAERGISAQQLLAGQSVGAALLDQPAARISAIQWGLLVNKAMHLIPEPALGYACGLRMRPSANGFLGYAILSCGSMREAMDLLSRYFQTRQRGFGARFSIGKEHAAIEVHELQPILPIPRLLERHAPAGDAGTVEQVRGLGQMLVLRRFFYEHILLGVARGAAAILGRELTQLGGEIWCDWPEPEYHAAWRDQLPAMRFAQASNQLRFPAAMLDLRPVLADPLATKQAIELCERELAQTGAAGDSTTLRVCAELVQSPRGGYPDQEAVAARLHMSSRTLARKLRDDGGSFQQLLDDARRRDACALIENGGLELQDVATRLGYRNPANFTRAFRKWTGESPSQYQKRSASSAASPRLHFPDVGSKR
jgi:AraC-like DNA-binding protein